MSTPLGAAEARRVAASLAAGKGWPFVEPVDVRRRRSVPLLGTWRWVVTSNAEARGRKVRVEVDARSGAVLASAFNLR